MSRAERLSRIWFDDGTIMAGKLSTHVLDTAAGRPAAGVRITVYMIDSHGGGMGNAVRLRSVITNADGRTDGPLLEGSRFTAGHYRLDFEIGEYFAAAGHPDAKRFLDVIPIAFTIDDATVGYHVP